MDLSRGRPPSSLWADLDAYKVSGDWDETDNEAAAYDKWVMEEINHKIAAAREDDEQLTLAQNEQSEPLDWDMDPSSDRVPSSETEVDDMQADDAHKLAAGRVSVPPHSINQVERGDVSGPLPSFHPSHIAKTSTPHANTDLPYVPTPSTVSTPLSGPSRRPLPSAAGRASRLALMSRQLDTPDHIDSPVDTPDTSGEGVRPARHEPATPVPLGTPYAKLKGKKDYQALTKHFEAFTKGVEKERDKLVRAVEQNAKRGKGRSKAPSPQPGLGGRIFEGLRFCVPPEVGMVSKHKLRWEIISKLGADVQLQPDTATTHIISDGRSAILLARHLGLKSLSELPEETICVKWDWVVQCKMAGAKLAETTWLSFPKTTLSRAPTKAPTKTLSRMMDITAQLKGQSSSISKRREHTASDSETESLTKRPKPLPVRPASTVMPAWDKAAQGITARAPQVPTVATSHVLPTGPGWVIASGSQKDGLDEVIDGVKSGELKETETAEAHDALDPNHAASSGQVTLKDDHNVCLLADQFKCGQSNDGSTNKGPNEWLALKFDQLHDTYEGVQGKNFFSIRQYQNAASIIRRTPQAITSGAQARKIKGIGQSIADRIDEFITGSTGRLDYEDTDRARIVSIFREVYGVGKNHANQLYQRGARSVEDLRANAKEFGLTAGQLIGIDLYDDLKSRIPREECKEIFELIRQQAFQIDKNLWIEIMGSYRRGQETSGDVDILITRNTDDGKTHKGVLKELVNRLKLNGVITHDLSLPNDWNALEAKWMGVGRLPPAGTYRRIDILAIPYEFWGAALIYFTGNNIFNRSLRLYARKKGYSLNQRGLYKGVIRQRDGTKTTEGVLVASKTEQEIFDTLGLRWRHPHQRRP